MSHPLILAVDLGKTTCRLEMRRGEQRTGATGAGAPGLADAGGVERAVGAIEAVRHRAFAGDSPAIVSVGAAGVLSAPDAASRLASRLAEVTGAEVAVTSDVVTAHAGAFGGAPGTLLIAGTGSVAYDLSSDGLLRRSGGWGPWLGDEGSGQWIGRHGLAAVLAAADGRGPTTLLTERAIRLAPVDSLARWIADDAAPAARLAGFAPAVLELAASGDPVASSIVDHAVRHLVTVVLAARRDTAGSPTAVVGGLTSDPHFLARCGAALRRERIETVLPEGTAIDGAVLIATSPQLAHEKQVHRAR